VKDARTKSLQESMHLQETKIISFQQTLAEAGKEAAASRQRANAAEERAIAAEQVGVERAREATARLHLENRELSHRLEEAETSKIVRADFLRCLWLRLNACDKNVGVKCFGLVCEWYSVRACRMPWSLLELLGI
jgi:hypothetical protein